MSENEKRRDDEERHGDSISQAKGKGELREGNRVSTKGDERKPASEDKK